MHLDAGVDTGEIIHQVRPRIFAGDTFHQVGNRLILDMAPIYADLIRKLPQLERLAQPRATPGDRVYRNRDFDDAAVEKLYAQLSSGLLERYLGERSERCRRVPIVEQPRLLARRAD
jgi:hypothetical protein